MVKKRDFTGWSEKDYQREIKKLDKKKKYGVVWEPKSEKLALRCRKELPVLKEDKKKEIKKNKTKLINILIEGDNYHALSVMNYTHQGKIDVIYIDPPYNTGSQTWRYNNNYVDSEDVWKHSKWLSFMEKRLKLAKNLLSKHGFIICAIDANELFSLGLLMDEIFGEHNRIGLVTVLHNPKGRNFTRWFSANSEYMLIYAKNVNYASFNEVAIDDKIKATFNYTERNGKKYRLEPLMRSRTETLRKNKPKFWYPIYVSPDLKSITLKKKKDYNEVYPITKNGKEATWINLPKTFREKNKNNIFIAKKENGKINIYRKYYEQQIFKNVWTDQKYQSEFHGTNLIKKILGDNIFDYPKSLYLVEDILKITSRKKSIILDFFAGSGTTGHAVMKMNKEDGGQRKFILCTNNENAICEEVTYPRIKNVIVGYSHNGKKVEGLINNLKYFKTDFVCWLTIYKVCFEVF
jgi:adenine-specific DNA-methyltransferase